MKKKSVLLLVVCFLLCCQTAFAELTKVADHVYAYVGQQDCSPGHSFAANAGIVVGKNGVLVVDTLISAMEGERFLADIRRVTDMPIKYVVNTHTHLDHAFGDSVFARLGATVISHDADRDLLARIGVDTLKNAGKYGLKPEEMTGTQITLPTLTFSERMRIDLGGETVELIHPVASHTAGSIVVSIPSCKTLFVGDILFTDFHPYLADSDIAGWSKALDTLLAMDVEKIVPGHGPLSVKKDLAEMKAYLLLFDSKARELAATSQDGDAIAAQLLQALPPRSMAQWMIATNVKGRYLGKK
jgi:glyoxylase-like metal-dependent hydrolase (beta-lactamase superfamily II)